LLDCVETNQRVGVRIPRGAEILEILRESPSSLGTSQVAPLSHRPIERRWIGNRLVLREWEHALRAAPHRRDSPLVHRERADASRLNGAEALDTSTGDLRRFVGVLAATPIPRHHRGPLSIVAAVLGLGPTPRRGGPLKPTVMPRLTAVFSVTSLWVHAWLAEVWGRPRRCLGGGGGAAGGSPPGQVHRRVQPLLALGGRSPSPNHRAAAHARPTPRESPC
jgi:hypothetical protein